MSLLVTQLDSLLLHMDWTLYQRPIVRFFMGVLDQEFKASAVASSQMPIICKDETMQGSIYCFIQANMATGGDGFVSDEIYHEKNNSLYLSCG